MFPILWGLLQSIVFTVFSNAGGVLLSTRIGESWVDPDFIEKHMEKYLAVSYKHPKDNWEWALERVWTWSFDCRVNPLGWDSDPLVYVAMSHKSTMFNRKNINKHPNIWIFQLADMLVHHGERYFSDCTYLAWYLLRWVVPLSKQAAIVRCRQGTARGVARHIQ